VIKYLGSKRRLVPVLAEIGRLVGARTVLDLFSGTSRVSQAYKATGATVTAVDRTRCAETLARCYVATDATTVDRRALDAAIAELDQLPGRAGYVTETFCIRSRFFQPANGARIDAIRQAIADDHAGGPLEPVLLTSLIEAADRVDSTVGVQMAYVKQWAARSYRPLRLEVPALLPGGGRAVRGDACELVDRLGTFDLAYLDPPYNQHRYEANYHIWETLVAWDDPPHYGLACKRTEVRDAARSAFNQRSTCQQALTRVVSDVPARVTVVSCNDECWVSPADIIRLVADREAAVTLAFPSRRYVGARIGVHDPQGRRVGTPGPSHNREVVVVAGPAADVGRVAATWPAQVLSPEAVDEL
jgi:adenine-specific DNA-methyltransferase